MVKLKINTAILMLLAITATMSSLSSCTNPLSEIIRESVISTNRPTIEIYPDFPTLSTDSRIVVYFSKPADPDSLNLSGNLSDICNAEWMKYITTEEESDTQLILTPKTSWPVGDEAVISISCKDTEGYESEISTRTFGVINEALYVSPSGSDDNPGTPQKPLASIDYAERLAGELNLNWTSKHVKTVKLSGGIFEEPETHNIEGIKLDGGWKPDWTEQNPAVYESIIRPDFSGVADNGSLYRVLSILAGETDTVVQNLTIDIRNAPGEVHGIAVTDSSPAIRNVKVTVTDSDQTYALSVEGRSSPEISGCRISFENTGTAYGITCLSMTNQPTEIRRTEISLNNCGTGNGIFSMNSRVDIESCRISIYGGNDSTGIYGFTSEMSLKNSIIDTYSEVVFDDTPLPIGLMACSAEIRNNTMIFQRFGILASIRSNPAVENNLFIFRETTIPAAIPDEAVYSGTTDDSDPVIFDNNHCSGFDRVMWFADGTGSFVPYTKDEMETFLTGKNASAVDNTATAADESTAFNPDWSLTGAAPTAITSGGKNLYSVFTTDIDGNPRPESGAWSVGAYNN